MNTEEKLEIILKIAEDNVEDDVLMCMKMAINDGHHDEWTSRYAVSEMVPVCYVGMNPKPKSMCEWMDMLENGIIDPAKVTRSALLNAASISGLFITTEAAVAEIPSKEPAMPAGPEY